MDVEEDVWCSSMGGGATVEYRLLENELGLDIIS